MITAQLHTEAASSSSITPLTMSACRNSPATENGAALFTGAPLPIAYRRGEPTVPRPASNQGTDVKWDLLTSLKRLIFIVGS
jgi:hypothetical protein